MFNLGYKEVVLNDLTGVTGDGAGKLVIAGYGQVDISTSASQVPVDPAAEKASWATLPSGGDYADVKIVLRKLKTDARETIHFSAKDASAIEIIAGYDAWKNNHQGIDSKLVISGTLTTEIQPGFEAWSVVDVFVRTGNSDSIEISSKEVRLIKTEITAGYEGAGQGWQIEASRKLGTFVNSYPYGQQHGGNSIGVDLDAGYKEYDIVIPEAVNADWEGPEFVKHAYVSANMPAEDFHFVVYVHEDFVGAFEAL